MSPRDLHAELGGSYDTLRAALITLRDRGELVQPVRGKYALPAAPPGRIAAADYLAKHDAPEREGVCLVRVRATDGRPLFSFWLTGDLSQDGEPIELVADAPAQLTAVEA